LRQQEIDQQRQIIEATISGQEKEKNELGKELHDNINQLLATVKMYLVGYTLGMTEVGSVVYCNPGIGRMTTGLSMINSKTSVEILRWIYKLKEQVTDSYELLCKYLGIEPGS